MAAAVSYKVQKAPNSLPHIEWIELHNDGILHECAIMKRDASGNVLFFKTNDLDEIDKKRLAGILMDRNARTFELWDLMANKTLGNGVNALTYFNQLVRQMTPNGRILDPRAGQMGTGAAGTVNTNTQ
jgi:hypothetical protein